LSVAALGLVVSAACSLWIAFNAFRTHVVWGVATVLFPFAAQIYALAYWEENKTPLLLSMLGAGAAVAALLAGGPLLPGATP
jgi:hypothetical protein